MSFLESLPTDATSTIQKEWDATLALLESSPKSSQIQLHFDRPDLVLHTPFHSRDTQETINWLYLNATFPIPNEPGAFATCTQVILPSYP